MKTRKAHGVRLAGFRVVFVIFANGRFDKSAASDSCTLRSPAEKRYMRKREDESALEQMAGLRVDLFFGVGLNGVKGI